MLGYLLLAGALPFEGNVVEILMAHINQHPQPPSCMRSGEPLEPAVEALILRAMAKDPAERPRSAAAFRTELNAVMDLLDLGRRRRPVGTQQPESPRETALVAAFERSRVPQALISLAGRIELANTAFARLLGSDDSVEGFDLTETTLNDDVPGLLRALETAHADGKPCERRARICRGTAQPALALTLWFCPLPLVGTEVHLMIRVDEESGGS